MPSLLVVPHRGLHAAKTRLATALSEEERADLARGLLERVLGTLHAAAGDAAVLVISPDPELRGIEGAAGAELLVQRGMGLNAGLEQARGVAVERGAETLAVFHGDLPLLDAADVAALLEPVRDADGVAIGPDTTLSGTNALAIRPPEAIPFRFGPGSFEAHMSAARAAGCNVTVVERRGIAFDLDTPADLERYLSTAGRS